jgi:hypothetical protein
MKTRDQIVEELKALSPEAAALVVEFFDAEIARLDEGPGYYGEDIDYLEMLRDKFK